MGGFHKVLKWWGTPRFGGRQLKEEDFWCVHENAGKWCDFTARDKGPAVFSGQMSKTETVKCVFTLLQTNCPLSYWLNILCSNILGKWPDWCLKMHYSSVYLKNVCAFLEIEPLLSKWQQKGFLDVGNCNKVVKVLVLMFFKYIYFIFFARLTHCTQ